VVGTFSPTSSGQVLSEQSSTPTYYDSYGATSQAEAAARADSLAYLADQEASLNRQLGRTNTTLDQGLLAIGDNYNKGVSGANLNRSRFQEDWGVKKDTSERGRGRALDRIDTNARTLGNSLRQRLGLASGSDSSAYKITAPGAVARDATQDRTNVLEDYGVNFRGLDLSERRNKEDFESLLSDLVAQKQNKERGIRSDVLGQQNSISESLAELARQRALAQGGGYAQVKTAMQPYVDQITQREGQLDNLFNQYRTAYNVKPVRADIPELRKYLVDRATINAQNEAGTQDPMAYYLQNQDEEEQLV
jgi:hypothetical protein